MTTTLPAGWTRSNVEDAVRLWAGMWREAEDDMREDLDEYLAKGPDGIVEMLRDLSGACRRLAAMPEGAIPKRLRERLTDGATKADQLLEALGGE